MLRLEFLLTATFLFTGIAQASPFQISQLVTSGDCVGSDIQIVEENGESYIKAFFDDDTMTATADGIAHDKRRCTMDFKLKVANGWKLDVFEFAVDGTYQLSTQGTARLTVSHRAGNAPAIRTTRFISLQQGDEPFGEVGNGGFSGTVYGYQLGGDYPACASTIPLETSIFAAVTQPTSDSSGVTQIVLDEGNSDTKGYVIGKVKAKPCS